MVPQLLIESSDEEARRRSSCQVVLVGLCNHILYDIGTEGAVELFIIVEWCCR